MRLVADVGGTNTRIGLAQNGTLLTDTVRSYRNDDFIAFDDVINQYLQDHAPAPLAEMAVAVAGPVGDGAARLTNRDWSFSTRDLSAAHGGIPVTLLNDLGALGQALPVLSAEGLHPVWGTNRPGASQSLVVGIGTGFNVSPVVAGDGVSTCLNAEAGHVALPLDIYKLLHGQIGAGADRFLTVEHLFSGRGLAHLFTEVTGQTVPPQDVLSAKTAAAIEVQNLYAEALALLCRNLLLAYMPTGGLAFAGSVARNLLALPARARFTEVYAAPMDLADGLHAPVMVIRDDAAALRGCALAPVS